MVADRVEAAIALAVFRATVRATVPGWVWVVIARWLVQLLTLAVEAGVFARWRVQVGRPADRLDLDTYSPATRDAIAAFEAGVVAGRVDPPSPPESRP